MLTIDLDRAHIEPGGRVLDLGCGAGRHAFACLRAGADVVALDADRDEVGAVAAMVSAMRNDGELAERKSGGVVGDACSLPLADGAFDQVIISEVLEHLPDDEAVIQELIRVLRPGGLLALSVPRGGPERVNWALSWAYHEVPGGHLRIYRRRELIDQLRRSGLMLVGSHYAHGLHAPYWWLRCLVGIDKEHHPLVERYHRLLVRDIMFHPRLTRYLDRALNPMIGKSLVLYFTKPVS